MKSTTLKPHQVAIVAAGLASLVLWAIPYVHFMLLPLEYLNTHIHELCHAIVGTMTGAQVDHIEVHVAGDGVTPIRGGNVFLEVSAGYVGATIVGLFIMLGSRTEKSAKDGPAHPFDRADGGDLAVGSRFGRRRHHVWDRLRHCLGGNLMGGQHLREGSDTPLHCPIHRPAAVPERRAVALRLAPAERLYGGTQRCHHHAGRDSRSRPRLGSQLVRVQSSGGALGSSDGLDGAPDPCSSEVGAFSLAPPGPPSVAPTLVEPASLDVGVAARITGIGSVKSA